MEKQATKKAIRHDDLFKLHRILAGDVMDQGTAGSYRTIQVRVGNHFPRAAVDVSGLMFELLEWWNKKSVELSPVLSSAILHYRFEDIHPFADGNGRTKASRPSGMPSCTDLNQTSRESPGRCVRSWSARFGLVNIVSAAPAGQGIRFSVEHVAAWARVLVLRMVHHREAILGEARRKWIETLTARIRLKLADGPQSVRDLTRRSYRLDAPTCLQVLERLADSGLVVRRGSHWQLAIHGRSKTLTTVDV